MTAVFYFHVDICTHLSGTFNRTKKTFGFRRFIIMGVGGTLHFHIVYNLHHSFLGFLLFPHERNKSRETTATQMPIRPPNSWIRFSFFFLLISKIIHLQILLGIIQIFFNDFQRCAILTLSSRVWLICSQIPRSSSFAKATPIPVIIKGSSRIRKLAS